MRLSPSPCATTATPARERLGFGLMELVVVMGLVALLAGMAAPALHALLGGRQLQSAAQALVADLRLARTEAIRRAAVVTMCSSLDGKACSSAAAWREGWLVFADPNANETPDAGEEVIRVQQALVGVASVGSLSPKNDRTYFSFHPTGWAKASAQTLVFRSPGAQILPRMVCISNQGRPSLRPAGTVECG